MTTTKSTSPSEERKLERSAGFVLYRVGEDGEHYYLLLRHSGGHWGFPKGRMEPGESEQSAASRETCEETGIEEFLLLPGFRAVSSYRFRRGDRIVDKQVIYFLGHTATSDFALSDEHIAGRWLDYPAAQQSLTYPEAQEILRRAEEFLHREG